MPKFMYIIEECLAGSAWILISYLRSTELVNSVSDPHLFISDPGSAFSGRRIPVEKLNLFIGYVNLYR